MDNHPSVKLEEIRGRHALLKVSLAEEIDEEFRAELEEDIEYLLSLADIAIEENPEVLNHDS